VKIAEPVDDPWAVPFRRRLHLLPAHSLKIAGVMGSLLAFIFLGLGAAAVVAKVAGSNGGAHKATVTPRDAKAFGVILVDRGNDYRSFDASGATAGQLGPGKLGVGGKVYTLAASTPLYGPGCPLLAQVLIPAPPVCFAQVGVATDDKTITFVTTMATPEPDNGTLPLTYKGTVAQSSTRELDLNDGTILRWGDNPQFDPRCKPLTRPDFAGVSIEAKLDRFIGRILEIDCPDRSPTSS
jgi:hypothetical protein